MDPFLTFIIFNKIVRHHARKAHAAAAKEHAKAKDAYHASQRAMLRARDQCLLRCRHLAHNRQASVGIHWPRVHKLLIACGFNGGLFAPSRSAIFEGKTEGKVREVFSEVLRLRLTKLSATSPGMNTMAISLIVRGMRYALHSKDVLIADAADDLFNTGPLADLPENGDVAAAGLELSDFDHMLDFASLVLSARRLYKTFQIFQAIKGIKSSTSEMIAATEELDRQSRMFEEGARRADDLLSQLEEASYELFKWTIVAQEYSKLAAGSLELADAFHLPDGFALKVYERARALWVVLNEPVFP